MRACLNLKPVTADMKHLFLLYVRRCCFVLTYTYSMLLSLTSACSSVCLQAHI